MVSTSQDLGLIWEFIAGRDRRTVRLDPALAVSTIQGAVDAALAGFGITRVLSYQVSDAISRGELVEILIEHEDREMPIHFVHSEGRRPAAKIRAFIDMTAKRLRAEAPRLAAQRP